MSFHRLSAVEVNLSHLKWTEVVENVKKYDLKVMLGTKIGIYCWAYTADYMILTKIFF